MKKFILFAALGLLFLNPASVFAADTPNVGLYEISGDKNILAAVKMMKNTPANASYKRILGNNPTEKPIKIEFKNLALLNKNYDRYDGLGCKSKGVFRIYISDKHKDAPKEALASLIAGLAVHVDEDDSINEEVFAWALEAVVWSGFLKQNPELASNPARLIERENTIAALYGASAADVSYIKELIERNNGYRNFKKASNGYSDEELDKKIQILYRIYAK